MALEDLLTNLDEQKVALEKERNEWREKTEKLDQLIANYENLSTQYEVKRLKLKLEAKKLKSKRPMIYKNNIQKLQRKLR